MLNYIALSLLLAANAQTSNNRSENPVTFDQPPIHHDDRALTEPIPMNNPAQWVTANDYPSKALRQELEGNVRFKLTINEIGRVSNCAIISSSGHETLDSVTCELIMQRAQFRPAFDKSGKPKTGFYTNRVRWVIPEIEETPLRKADDYAYTADIELDDEGKIISCVEKEIGINSFGSICSVGETLPSNPLSLIYENLTETKKFRMLFLFYQEDNLKINNIANQSAEESVTILEVNFEITPDGNIRNCTEESNQIDEKFCPNYPSVEQEFQPFEASESNRKFKTIAKIIVPKDDTVKAVPPQ